MQWLYLVGQGTIPTKVYFRYAALHESAQGYNARSYSQSKSDVSLHSISGTFFFVDMAELWP